MPICYTIQQKIHETRKIWHPSEQNYMYFFVHFKRDSNISRGVQKFWKFPEGRGWGRFWGLILEKSRGGGGPYGKSRLWGWYGYFLEPHISVHSLVLISVATAKHRNNGNFPVKERLTFSLKFYSCC